MATRRFTHRPEPRRPTSIRLLEADVEPMYLAASREGISRSEFVRRALRERVARVLTSAARRGA
jgi:hypothetical protein